MLPSTTVADTMRHFLKHQFALNSRFPLAELRRRRELSYTLHPALIDFIHDNRAAVLTVIHAELANIDAASRAGLLREFLLHIQAFIYENNQFITLSDQDKAALTALYADYMYAMLALLEAQPQSDFAAAFEAVVMNHLVALQAYLSALAANRPQVDALIDHQVVCAEYSAELQLSVLGLTDLTLPEPILDVGCGLNGHLVHYLRSTNREAYGIDRLVHPLPYLTEVDWLNMDFGSTAWGTILSHMAFSNHFIFHHHSREDIPDSFAHQYMAMLRSLKRGGILCYAPSLPFIEQFIPHTFAVVTHAGEFPSTRITRLE